MEPLRVGLVGPIPPPNGGMALQARQLAGLLEGEGLDVRMLPTNAPYRPAWVGRIPGLRAVFRLVPYLYRVWRLAGQVDVVHMLANSGWSWQLFAAPVIWLGRLRGTPVVVNYRGGEARAYFERSFSRVRPTLARASGIVVPSGYLQQVFGDFGFDADVVPNIINLERFHPPRQVRDTSVFELVVTRNLEAIYGIDTAIRAAALLRRHIPNLRLSIAGSGPLAGELTQLVERLDLGDCVFFVGRLEPDEVASLYRRAAVFLNPALVDNMPNSVLEAMASGLPVVSSNVGGVPFIVEHEATALLVEPGDPAAMAGAVRRLHDEPALAATLAQRGLEEVRAYAWPSVRDQWLGQYRELARSEAA